ncbi:DUF4173 domain-containing protein, partial [Plantactinospora sp. S1510]
PVLGAVAAAAAVSAVSLPLTRPGLGWLVGGVAGAAALVTAARIAARPTDDTSSVQRSPDGSPGRAAGRDNSIRGRFGWSRPLWGLATLALLGVGTIRAAGWLFVLCLLTAAMTAALTVAGGRSVRAILFSGLIPSMAVFRSMPWVARGLARPARPGQEHGAGRALATVAVSLVLLTVFGLLFSSADAAFAGLVDRGLPDLSPSTVVRWVFVFGLVGAALLGAVYVLAAPPDLTGLTADPGRKRLRRAEWVLPVALLDTLFVLFVAVQVTSLFGGSDHVLRTAGLTYAEYARSGFWQLLAVSVLTLLVIGAAAWWAPRETRTDRALIRILLGGLTLLSLVVVASALYRMDVYADAYGATRLRLLVATCELWLGLIFVLIAAAGIRLSAGWLPQLALGTAVLALLALAAVNPDRLIAERNVDMYARTGRIDVGYLSRLSADAVPVFDRLPAELRRCASTTIATELPRDDWRETNLGRIRARQILARQILAGQPTAESPVPPVRGTPGSSYTGC